MEEDNKIYICAVHKKKFKTIYAEVESIKQFKYLNPTFYRVREISRSEYMLNN